MKKKLFVVLLILSVATGAFEKALAQHSPNPLPTPAVVDPPWNWLQVIFMNNTFRIGGVEAGISTYNHHIGLPVFWVQNQLKLAPQLVLAQTGNLGYQRNIWRKGSLLSE